MGQPKVKKDTSAKPKLSRKARIAQSREPGQGEVEAQGGMRNYVALLGLLHAHLRPRTYVEIGVASGRSLSRAQPKTLCIGIDPEPTVRRKLPPRARVFELTSDEFFADHDVTSMLQDDPIDLAFIDGMHLFEYALRDFINLEKACGEESVIVVHDCNPPSARAAARERETGFWTGDVWKLIPCLKEHRPDLDVTVFDVPPSGLAIVTNLDPTSITLAERYARICDEFVDLGFEESDVERAEMLNLMPAEWNLVEDMLPAGHGADEAMPRKARTFAAAVSHTEEKLVRTGVTEKEAPLFIGPERRVTDIVLYEYPQHCLDRLQKSADGFNIQIGAPPVHHYQNVAFDPKYAALYTQDGHRILETCLRRNAGLKYVHGDPPEEWSPPKDAIRIDRPVVFCGALKDHWGHFLTEGIARLWPLHDGDIPESTPLLFQDSKFLPVSWIEKFFHYAGIARERFIEPQTAVILRDAIVPNPSFSLGSRGFASHLSLPERVAERICGKKLRRSNQPVYLSRRHVSHRYGKRAVSEAELEECLGERGVRIASPERLSFEDQVRLFNEHDTFIGLLGSAFHSLLYALPRWPLRTAVIGVSPRAHHNSFIIDYLKGIEARYVFDPALTKRSGQPSLDAKTLCAHLERLSVL